MTEKDKLSIKFQFHDRKFEVFTFSDETIINLKIIIKNSLLKRVNLKKYGYNTIDIIENNMVINKDTQPVRILREYDDRQLNSVGILDNEELVITFNILNQPDKFGENEKDFIENETDITQYSVYCKKIPGDNSCIFNAINYALNQCLTEAQILRELIAVEIKQNPQIYNEAVLETNPLDYCDWIMRSDSWGGGIELSILSKYFLIRIDVIDIMNNTIEIIGDMYSKVIYLLYNGSHYDVFIKKLKEGRELGIFEISDKYIKKEVLDIANEIKKKNKARNAKIIKLKCNDCNCILEADFDARNHLKTTGHVNFQQIEDNYSN